MVVLVFCFLFEVAKVRKLLAWILHCLLLHGPWDLCPLNQHLNIVRLCKLCCHGEVPRLWTTRACCLGLLDGTAVLVVWMFATLLLKCLECLFVLVGDELPGVVGYQRYFWSSPACAFAEIAAGIFSMLDHSFDVLG